jgi:hypothetical protein
MVSIQNPAFVVTPQPASSAYNRRNKDKARTLEKLLGDLIEQWEKRPDELDRPVRDVTRTTLAAFMSWAEALFDDDHPIAITIRYLGSVGNYDRSEVLEEKKLTYGDALEYSVMLRSVLQSWLDEGYSGSRRPPDPNPPEGRRYNLVASLLIDEDGPAPAASIHPATKNTCQTSSAQRSLYCR